MNRQRHSVILLSISMMFCAQNRCWAEDVITLEKALRTAYEANPRMAEARYTIAAARGDLSIAAALPDPEIGFELGGLKRNEEGRRQTNLDSIEIRQPLDPPGVRELKRKIARNDISAQEQYLKSVWSTVYATVRRTYMQIILDKKNCELADETLELTRQMFSRVQIAFEAGQALQNDLQRARIELLRAESERLAAQKQLQTDKANLNLLLGRPMETAIEIEEKLQEEKLDLRLDELISMALGNNPNLKMERFNLNSRTAEAAKERAGRLPSLFIGFDRTREDYEDDYALLFGVTLPLWSGNRGAIEKTAALKQAQQIRVEATKREVIYDVYQAYLEAQLVSRQADLAKESLQEAAEMLRLAELHYTEGKLAFVNYLDQTKTASETKRRYYQSLFQLSQAITEIESAVYFSIRKEGFLQ